MKTKINHRSLQTPVSRSSRVFFCMKTFLLLLAGLTAFATASFAQVDVTATGGTLNASYTTLGAAFAAINAGTHTGTIGIGISASTVEGATPATLNSSGAGSASYTSVTINPTADGVSISGNPVTGFGVIQLNGADNVTIDGDNPSTFGTNRNLTVSNTAIATVIANSVIRIATSTAVTSADNNTIRNCILLGNVTGGNSSLITSTAGSSNSSFGIYCGGNGGATDVGAPTAITSVTTNTAPSGTTINALLVDNNSINQCARAIVFNGAAASVSTGVTISNNTIGDQSALAGLPPYTAPSTTVYTKGIWVAGTTLITVSGNTIANILSYVGTTMTAIELNAVIGTGPNSSIANNTITGVVNNGTVSSVNAILVSSSGAAYSVSGNTISNVQVVGSVSLTGAISVSPASATIEKNKITTVYSRGTSTFGCFGINTTAGNNHIIRNNFVADVNHDMSGGAAFSTSFGVFGIRVATGTGHKIYHNSVNLFGATPGAPTTSLLSAALCIVSTASTGMDIRDNILSNTTTGGTTSVARVSIYLPSAATVAMNLTDNNNDYNFGADATRQGAGQAGTTAGTNFFTTLPALAAYTAPLSAAGTNDNASQAVDPLYSSSTDLHITAVSPMIDTAVDVLVTTDIDGQPRPNGPLPDIGADEFYASPGTVQFSTTAYNVTEAGGTATITATRTGGSSGAAQVDYATVAGGSATGGAACGVGVDYVDTSGTLMWANNDGAPKNFTVTVCTDAVTDPGETVNLALSNPITVTLGSPSAAVLTIADSALFSGSVNVGTAEVYTSLTNPGGLFAAINTGALSGNTTVNITSDLTVETGVVALNQWVEQGVGGYTLTIRPSGAPRTISGTSTGGGLIKLNGADRVTIDGSLGPISSPRPLVPTRDLTITNGNAGGTVIWIASNPTAAPNVADGANNDTVKNCIISGNTGVTIIGGILTGSGATLGGDAEAPNNNITIQNNAIFRVQNSAYIRGGATLDTGCVVTGNTFGSAVAADKNQFRGMLIGNSAGFLISGNTINGVVSTASSTATMTGIQLAFVVNGGTITGNTISDIKQINTAGWGSNGIFLGQSSLTANVTVSNNFISDVASQGFDDVTVLDNGYGIMITSGAGYNIYYNSINLGTNQGVGAATGHTAAINIDAAVTTAGAIDLRDNILADPQTLGSRYGVLDSSTAAVFAAGGINYNDYFAQNVGFLGADQVTLADWQTATGQDANSVAADPGFASATDLHITNASPAANVAVPIAAVTVDIDGQARSATIPDMGADEVPNAVLTATGAVSRKVHGGFGPFDIPLPLSGSPGIECRGPGGGTNPYQVVVSFANPIASVNGHAVPVPGDATLTGTGSVSAITIVGSTVVVDLTGVATQQQIGLTLTNVSDGTSSGDIPVPMIVLVGDSAGTGNNSVNSGDIAFVKSKAGAAVIDGTNFRADIAVSGTINASDISLVKSKSGNQFP